MSPSKNKKSSSPVSKKVKIKRSDLQELQNEWLRFRFFIAGLEDFLRNDFLVEVFDMGFDFSDPDVISEVWTHVQENLMNHDYVRLLRILYDSSDNFIQPKLRADVVAAFKMRRLNRAIGDAVHPGHKCGCH